MKPDLQPHLEDDLVQIRPLRQGDFEGLFQAASDPSIWEQHPVPRYRPDVFENFFQDSLNSQGALIIIEKESGEVIGSSRYNRLDYLDNAVEIGWTFLSREYWGGRYNRAVKTLMMEHAFKYFEEVIFYIASSNIRSQKAIEKIGGVWVDDEKYRSTMPNNDIAYRICRWGG